MQILFFLALIVVAVLATSWRGSRGRDLLAGWAAREGYELESADYCWFWHGPFWWRSGKGQVVYRVVVRDREGVVRRGYVRLGGMFLGLLSDEVAVIWDG